MLGAGAILDSFQAASLVYSQGKGNLGLKKDAFLFKPSLDTPRTRVRRDWSYPLIGE